MRWIAVIASAFGLMQVAGCAGTTTGSDCTSRYEQMANAATKPALKRALLHDVDPRVHSLRMVASDRNDDKAVVNLLNAKRHLVLSLDMWQRDNGTWTAQRWSQCTD